MICDLPSSHADRNASRICKDVQNWLTAGPDADHHWTVFPVKTIGKAGRRRRILRAHDDADGTDWAIKAHDSRLRNLTEFKALRQLHALMPESVAPVHLSRGFRFYAMEWADAPLLSQALGGTDHATLVGRAAKWMSRLHRSTQSHPARDTRLPGLPTPASYESSDVTTARGRIQDRLGHASALKAPRAVLHGDLHANNLFVYPQAIKAFDREKKVFDLTYLDVSSFLTDLESRRRQAAHGGMYWAGNRDTDRRAFFETYGPIEERHLPLFDVIEDIHVFIKWRRAQRRDDHTFTEVAALRGFVGEENGHRPGRLVKSADGSVSWCQS